MAFYVVVMTEKHSTVPAGNDGAEPTSWPYLLAWKLHNRRVLIVGGGAIGTGKVETLLGSGAHLVVVDPNPSPRVEDLAAQGRLVLRPRRFRPFDVKGAALVVAATGNTKTNRVIRRWAKFAGAVVNAVDDTANCDVIVPAVVRRGPATIAVTTDGSTPAGARFLREEIDNFLPRDLGHLLDAASDARRQLRASGEYRYDAHAWRQLFFEPGFSALRSGRSPAVGEIQRRFLAEFAHSTKPLRSGHVSLVGAGPGGADLITVRGSNALASADVVIYDRLADPALLDLAPPAAERIPVGKGKGFGVAQSEIHDLMIERSHAGNHVVRLKGGDPFIFGRGLEEYESLTAAGVAVAVVPGLSSALSGPALAGISLTDRRFAAGFTVISGHRVEETATEDEVDAYDWSALSRTTETLVVLMASSTAKQVAARLLAAGCSPEKPAAFVHAAGTTRQRRESTNLRSVALDGCPFASPTVLVIGEAARPADHDGHELATLPVLETVGV